MRNFKRLTMLSMVLGLFLMFAPTAHAQRIGVDIGVGGPGYVGVAPVCPYGYYDYYPYACAPYGFYGPEWFSGGIFIGAGPWGHGWHGGHPGYYGHGYIGRQGAPAYRGGGGAHFNSRGGGHFNGGASHGFARGGGGGHRR
jgi:hypothetical protein